MPASPPGQITVSIADADGNTLAVAWFFDPASRVLRDNPQPWTGPDGVDWPAGTGALIAQNGFGRGVRVRVNDQHGDLLRQVAVPAGSSAVSAADLAAATAPDGPFATADDLAGATFDVS